MLLSLSQSKEAFSSTSPLEFPIPTKRTSRLVMQKTVLKWSGMARFSCETAMTWKSSWTKIVVSCFTPAYMCQTLLLKWFLCSNTRKEQVCTGERSIPSFWDHMTVVRRLIFGKKSLFQFLAIKISSTTPLLVQASENLSPANFQLNCFHTWLLRQK